MNVNNVGWSKILTALKLEDQDRQPCPIHGGSGNNFATYTRDGELRWTCHSSCQRSGNVEDLCKEIGVEPEELYGKLGLYDEAQVLWDAALPVERDPEVRELLLRRGLKGTNVKVMFEAMRSSAPTWAARWIPRYRLIIPMYDHNEKMKSLRAWRVFGTYGPKRKGPQGVSQRGLCMLRTGKDPVIIAEGEPDFLSACETWPDREVLGFISGSWNRGWGERYKDREVIICTDNDQAGDNYATKIQDTLPNAKRRVATEDLNEALLCGTIKDLRVEKVKPKTIYQLGDHVEVAEDVLNDLGVSRMCEGEVWGYRNKTWGLVGPELHQLVKSKRGSLIVGGEKDRALRMSDGDIKGIINQVKCELANAGPMPDTSAVGLIDKAMLSDGSFVDHGPELGIRYLHPVTSGELDRKAPTRFLRCLEEVWAGCQDKDQRIEFVRQFIRNCLFGTMPKYQKAVMFVGDGANGKSVIADTIASVMPPGSVSYVGPAELRREFDRSDIAGKLLNVVTEVSAKAIEGAAFKAVVSGDVCKARRPYGKGFFFEPVAGHLFSCNELPATLDQSAGFWRRWVVLDFPNTFEVNRDNNLKEELAKDRSAILAWALSAPEGLQIPESTLNARKEWEHESDPIAIWLKESEFRVANIEEAESTGGFLAKTIQPYFMLWAEQNGYRPVNRLTFAKRLSKIVPSRKTKIGLKYYLVRAKPATISVIK